MDMRAHGIHVESAGSGTPLVLLHGWGLHAGLFAPVVPALARSQRVHAVDLPGHGRSAPLRPWSIQATVASVAGAFATEHEPLDLLGWSLGGIVALAFARAHPGRVRRLVLVATTPKFVAGKGWPHAMTRETLRRFADELGVAYRPTLQRFLTLQVHGSESGRATLAALRHELYARGEPDAAALREALGTLEAVDLRDEVARVDVPALVIAGDRDALAPLEASKWLAAAMPRARLATIAGAAHAPFLSHRAAFLSALDAFRHDA